MKNQKTIKRFFGIIMALALCMELAVPAIAAEEKTITDPNGNLTVTNVLNETSEGDYEQEYTVYWIPDTGAKVIFLNVEDAIEDEDYLVIIRPELYIDPNTGELTVLPVGGGGSVSEHLQPDGTYSITLWLSESEKEYPEFYDYLTTIIYLDSRIYIGFIKSETSPPPPTTEAPSSWAADQVNAAIAANLVPQSLQSKYTQSATRAEFCALAVALYENVKGEITGRSTFTDTNDVNVQKAASIGVVSGVGDNKFDPDAQLTREQAAVMLVRLADAVGKPFPKQAATFADNSAISSWAAEQVGQVQAAEIMGGVGSNTFAPKDPYTREQSIITIMRLFDVVK